ncbi:MAG: NPCBM/NEW2 domain-containing protein [Pirellulales bacterium]|nr:NPCBM/NEW2 domain-containing protein [Pirellulales bacterium]
MNADPITLMHAYLDGELTAADRGALCDWLGLDAANVDRFVAECRIHSELCDTFWREGGGPAHLEDSDPALEVMQFPLSTLRSPPAANFVGGPAFSYMVATVVLCLMLLGAWAYKINYDRNIFTADSRSSTIAGPSDQSELVFVGRVTGMKDCRWAVPDTRTCIGASATLGREYSLASGMMEITYQSGARVILEGPCSYKVESSAGGFLAMGKLTANIRGQRSEAGGQRPKVGNQKSPNPQSLIPNPFVVRTPTAVVTDLGTEFGVEVAENGDTISHVFEGKIVVKAGIRDSDKRPATAATRDYERQLAAGESVRVSRVRAGTHHNLTTKELVRFTHPTTPPKFVRRIHEPIRSIDLLDVVVAGGDRRRGSGIDAASGRLLRFIADARTKGDGQFRPVLWSRIIDGVFIPDGRNGAVQVDSSGGAFDGFPETLGRTWGPLWARGAGDAPVGPDDDPKNWIHLMDRVEQFTPERRGLLCLHANAGITFDLEAVRRVMRWSGPMRFQAAAGMVGTSRAELDFDGQTDIWVVVDGRAAMKRDGLRRQDGAVSVDIELAPADRFLTLAATDGGDGITADWVVFGDPVLRSTTTQKEDRPMTQ